MHKYNNLEKLVDDLFPPCKNFKSSQFVPDFIIRKADDCNYSIDVEVPSMSKSDITISIDDGILKVSGEKENCDVDNTTLQISGVQYGKFEKEFSIGTDVDDSKIVASCSNGVLNIILPIKKESLTKSRQISIA